MFLGAEAPFPAGPFILPVKFNVPVSFVFAMKERSDHYHFYATKPVSYNTAKNSRERDIQAENLLNEYIVELEIILEKYPDQWFNYYDFWS